MSGEPEVITTTALEVQQQQTQALAFRHELSVEEVLARIEKVKEVMKRAMVENVHYGIIPGTDKPTLYKPGAELLNLIFRLDPQPDSTEQIEDNGHLTVKAKITLWHIPSGQRWGSGEGSCSTRETKYAFRYAKRKCPKCSAEELNRSKYPPKDKALGTEPGWYCYAKKGGCGAEFAANDAAIISQPLGLVANPNLADTYNTILKMANKRALIAAVLNVTAASDIFTQDLEDMDENERARHGAEGAAPHLPAAPPSAPTQPAKPAGNGGSAEIISDAQLRRLWAIASRNGWSAPQAKAIYTGQYGFEKAEQITRDKYAEIVSKLESPPEQP